MKLTGSMFLMKEKIQDGGRMKVVVTPNPDHIIFKAHFPGRPISPGVCTMQLVQEALEDICGKKLSLSCAKSVKFINILSPEDNEDVCLEFSRITEDAGGIAADATVSQPSRIIAKMSLYYDCMNDCEADEE